MRPETLQEAGTGAATAEPAAQPRARGALLTAVLLPFAVTRAGLLLAAWFAEQYAPSWTYHDPVGAARGWLRVPSLALDVWGRYDTGWYLDLAAKGYRSVAAPGLQSNLAFFPLYPAAVRLVHALLPAAWQGDGARYLVAVALANVFAVAALAAVLAVARDAWGDDAIARRTVLYLLLFPGSFFLSTAYSESLFLLLAAAAFLLAGRSRWWSAAPLALLLGMTRASGVLVAPALALLYLSRRGWQPRRIRLDALSLLAAPLGLLGHAVRLSALTGDPLALLHAQAAWGRTLTTPWATLAAPWHPKMGPIDLAATALLLALGLLLLRERRHAFGAYVLLSLVPILLSGTVTSATRFAVVAFPAFGALARLGRSEAVDRVVIVSFAIAQTLLFVSWSRFYWVA